MTIYNRLRSKLCVTLIAILLFPWLSSKLIDEFGPITSTATIAVMFYLYYELNVIFPYEGPIKNIDHEEVIFERATAVGTTAFAVGAVLMAQRGNITEKASRALFISLFLSTIPALPSAVARKRIISNGVLSSLQKLSVSYAAGFLMLAVAKGAELAIL